MREVEVKILEIDKARVEEKLCRLGATQTFDGELDAVWFDTPAEDLRAKDITFRLRREGSIVKLGTKEGKTRDGAKDLEETEVEIADFEKACRIIETVGFCMKRRLAKRRTSYALGDIHIDIDTYTGIPTFLEIEGGDADAVFSFAQKLGFGKEDCKAWGVSDLLRHYGQRP